MNSKTGLHFHNCIEHVLRPYYGRGAPATVRTRTDVGVGTDMGVERGGQGGLGTPGIGNLTFSIKFLGKNGCFLSFEWVK